MLGPGRPKKRPEILAVGELTVDQVVNVKRSREPSVKRFRDSHHKVARLFAAGLRPGEVAELSGYSLNRISVLYADPAFQELVAQKRKVEDAIAADRIEEYNGLILRNGLMAERMLADKLEDADEGDSLSTRELIAISRDAADRVGLSKRTIQTNVNIDFAARLDRAIKASDKVIELSVVRNDGLPVSPDTQAMTSARRPVLMRRA